MAVHINLTSQQLIPNVIPVMSQLQDVTQVYLVVAGRTYRDSAEHLSNFYKKKGIANVDLFYCEDANDFRTLKKQARMLFDTIKTRYPDDHIVLNATGGTKPMSIAFSTVFDDVQQKSIPIYTDSINKRVVVLNDNEYFDDLPYSDVFNIEDYFYLNRFEVITSSGIGRSSVWDRQNVTKEIMQIARHNPQAISFMNGLVAKTDFTNHDNSYGLVELSKAPPKVYVDFLEQVEKHGLIKVMGTTIQFSSPEAARYLGGGWFEELIYLAAQDAGISEVRLNIVGAFITRESEKKVFNEFDVVLLQNNQMMIIEAKTTNWSNKQAPGQATAVKLDSLTQLYGGSFGKGILATLFPLTENIETRISALRNVSILHVRDFESLVDMLSSWKKSLE